jgi:pantoate--beta-alanine ligase
MKLVETVAEMEAARERLEGAVGLVPTMGYLHEGHLSLVRRARRECACVVVSIFVNPTQFGPQEDFERYPRDPERDLRLLAAERADIVFMPPVDEMYPPGPSAALRTGFDQWVEVSGPLTGRLEGAARPGHFRGVTTIVARLFRVVRPHRAYFGQKDAQQLRVIRRMVTELGLPVEVIAAPTVREADGLAMSSRNVYLSPEQRVAALVLSRSLRLARRMAMEQGVSDADRVRDKLSNLIRAQPGAELEYVSISDEDTLEEVETIDRPVLVLLAARLGATRLIDNAVLVPRGMEMPERLRALVDS